MIKNLKDLMPGMICETRRNGFYMVYCDLAGRLGLLNERGTWARVDDSKGMAFGTSLEKQVIRVYGFTQTLPMLDQISEGMKFLYQTRKNTKELIKLWEVETMEETIIKDEIYKLTSQRNTIDQKLDKLITALEIAE